MTDYEEQEVDITPDLIKLVTGQFDLGSVLSLPLCGLGIRRIQNLDALVSLTVLDLSGNRLSRLANLESLGHCLQRIDLRGNELTRVEGLQALQALQVAKLQDNRIASIDTLLSLVGLPRLRAVYLQDHDGKHANPVCAVPVYRSTLLKKLPNLGNLDGEYFLSDECRPRIVGDGEGEDIRVPPPQRWLPKTHTSADSLTKVEFLRPTAKMLDDLLSECGSLLTKADKTIARQVEIRAAAQLES